SALRRAVSTQRRGWNQAGIETRPGGDVPPSATEDGRNTLHHDQRIQAKYPDRSEDVSITAPPRSDSMNYAQKFFSLLHLPVARHGDRRVPTTEASSSLPHLRRGATAAAIVRRGSPRRTEGQIGGGAGCPVACMGQGARLGGASAFAARR